jgi:tRNA(Ile)-lysidine synthase
VARWASELSLPHESLRWDGEKPSSGIQAAARRARYDVMAGWCRTHGATMLLTGHTQDDQAETVCMRLERTLSPASLAGIPAQGACDGLTVLRPLLGLRRAAIRDYLGGIGQAWIEDPSNDDPRFERVRIRLALRQRDHLVGRLAALAERAGDAMRLLDRCAGQWLDRHLLEHDSGFCLVPQGPFLGLPVQLKRRLLQRIVVHYGGGQHRPDPPELDRLMRWVEDGPPRCTLAGAILGRRTDRFWVAREPARISDQQQVVDGSGRCLWDGRFLIEAPPGAVIAPDRSGRRCADEAAPAVARQSWPGVSPAAGTTGPVRVTFLRLGSS